MGTVVSVLNIRTIMLIGYGSAGKYVLDYLSDVKHNMSDNDAINLIIVSRSSFDKVEPDINLSKIALGIRRLFVNVVYEQCDVLDIDSLSKIIKQYEPEVVINTTRYLSGFKYGDYSKKYNLPYGIWSLLSVYLTYKIYKAINLANLPYQVAYITTSLPDISVPMITKLPNYRKSIVILGVGNISHIEPRINFALSEIVGYHPAEFNVSFIRGSHRSNTEMSRGECHPDVNCVVDSLNKEIPLNYRGDISANNIAKHCNIIMPSGPVRNKMIASDVVRVLSVILSSSGELENIILSGYDSLGGATFKYNSMNDIELVRELDNDDPDNNTKSMNRDGIYDVYTRNNDTVLEFTEDLVNSVNSNKELSTHIQYSYSLSDIESFFDNNIIDSPLDYLRKLGSLYEE